MTARVGAMLIHGLGGTQSDLGSMHKLLKKAGIDVHAMTLPGHGTHPRDLIAIRAEHWIDAIVAQYEQLRSEYDQLHIIGMCMGALLALLLSERVGQAAAQGRLVLLASPVFLDGWSTPWYAGLRRLFYLIPGAASRMKVEEGEPYGIKNLLMRAVVRAKFERGDHFHYRWVPLSCVRQVDRLRARVLTCAHRVKAPTLIIHAREDELTSLRSAAFLQERITDAQTEILENSYHMICVDNDRDQVADSVLVFLGCPALPRRRHARRGEQPTGILR